MDPSLHDLISKLCMPYSIQEPLNDGELDSLADKVEIIRLKGLGVFLPTPTLPPGGVKKLTTRFVTTWHDKVIDGTKQWLRRFSW